MDIIDPVTGLEGVQTVITAVWGAVGNVVTTITTRPLLLIPIGFTMAAGAIGLAKSLMGTKRRGRR